jgi:hypothetical protein
LVADELSAKDFQRRKSYEWELTPRSDHDYPGSSLAEPTTPIDDVHADAGGTHCPVPTGRAELAGSLQRAVVTTWKYDPVSKNVTLKIQSISGKDTTAYSASITSTYADGSTDALPDGRASSEYL